MDIPFNQALTILFAIAFVLSIIGWFFRFLGNKSSASYASHAEAQSDLFEIENTPLLKLATLYHGELRGEDVALVIVSWAKQGIIKLRFEEKRGGQTEILLQKLKDLPTSLPRSEHAIFECLFARVNSNALESAKANSHAVDNDKIAHMESLAATVKLTDMSSGLSLPFSRMFQKLKEEVEKQQTTPAYHRFTFLEMFICLASLIMLTGGFSFFIEGQKFGSGEFIAYAGLELLLVMVYFRGLYVMGKKFTFEYFLGYLGVGFLIYLVATSLQTGYKDAGTLYFDNSYRHFGFIFGSVLALLAPSAQARTEYGRKLRDFFSLRRQKLSEQIRESEQFFNSLGEIMLYNSVESIGKGAELTTPDWYSGPAASNGTKLNVNRFACELERLGREMRMLAIVKQSNNSSYVPQ